MIMYPFNFFNLVFSPVKGYTFLSFIVMKIDTKSLNITDNFFFPVWFSPYSSDFELLDGIHNLFILVFLWFCT